MDVAEEESHHHTRLCDYCDSSVALVYCKADSAKLCLSCDKQVHVTNQLFAKHFRSLLCDSCDDSPASLFCDSENSVLCQNCDWERRNSSSSVRNRRPVEGFSGCPSVTEFLALLGLDDLSDKPIFPDSESLLWETPEIVTLSDLIASSGSGHNYRATDVPPLPKNRNATCGKHIEEMIRQLRVIARTEPNCLKHEALDVGFQFLEPEIDEDLFSGCEVSGLKWFEEDIPNNGGVAESDEKPHNVKRGGGCTQSAAISSIERNSALSRYKEKKKSRRYEKHIRYESRKVRAESRTRIRGRFAKADP